MYKYRNETNNIKLQSLLDQRRSPLLSKEGLEDILQRLTVFMTSDVIFFAAIYPKTSIEPLTCVEIDRADFLQGSDNESYFPVFSSIEKLKAWKPKLQKGEEIYVFNKAELLTFLQCNQNIAAVVLNPHEDDLLLHRMLLQNLIQVQKDNEN